MMTSHRALTLMVAGFLWVGCTTETGPTVPPPPPGNGDGDVVTADHRPGAVPAAKVVLGTTAIVTAASYGGAAYGGHGYGGYGYGGYGYGGYGSDDLVLGGALGGAPAPGSRLRPSTGIIGGPGGIGAVSHGRTKPVPTVRTGNATTMGPLDKNIIRRYVRRRLRRIRYCYEKQLTVSPGLMGMVTLKFTIGATGRVTSAIASGLHHNVSRCIENVARALQFPRPKAGGIVTVSYPFFFKPAAAVPAQPKPALHKRPAGPTSPSPFPKRRLDSATIRQTMARYRGRFAGCYKRRLKQKPTLAGRATVKFDIEASGRVIKVVVQGFDPQVDRCLAGVLRHMRFPSSSSKTTISYPFSFQPAGMTPPGTPVVVGVRKPQPHPAQRAFMCNATDPVPSLAQALPAFQSCYEAALAKEPELAGRLFGTLDVDAGGAVTAAQVAGVDRRGFEGCVAAAAKSVRVPAHSRSKAPASPAVQLVFSLALVNPAADPAADAHVIELTNHSAAIDGVTTGTGLDWAKRTRAEQQAVDKLINMTAADSRPTVIRANSTFDAGVLMSRFVNPLVRLHPGLPVMLARRLADGSWKIVNPLATADWSTPCGGRPLKPIEAEFTSGEIRLSAESVRQNAGARDTIGYARFLRDLRRFKYRGRSDIRLVVGFGVPFERFAKAVEIAVETGYFDPVLRFTGRR